jgi:PadR family transcriptional regulator, regulatory protein PadR
LSQIDIILLALLYEKDYYGYEIETIIEERNMREWTEIGFSSIYNSLNKLEKKGLIESRIEKEHGSPNRKVYSVIEKSREFILEEIKRMLQTPKRVYSEFDIGLAFSHLLPQNEIHKALIGYEENLEKRKQNILSRCTDQPAIKNSRQLNALFTRPLKLIEAEIEWVNDFSKE